MTVSANTLGTECRNESQISAEKDGLLQIQNKERRYEKNIHFSGVLRGGFTTELRRVRLTASL